MKKRNLIIILFAIFAIIIVAIFGSWYLIDQQNKQKQDYEDKISVLDKQVQDLGTIMTEEGTEVFANISSKEGWKNYKSKILGFELEVPMATTISSFLDEDPNHLVEFELDDKGFEVRQGEAEGISLDDFSYLDFVRDSFETMNNYKFAIFKAPDGYCDGPGCGSPFIAYVMQKDKTFYEIVFYGDAELSKTEKEILETFKLLQKD